MVKHLLSCCGIMLLFTFPLWAQNNDPVLFTVQNTPVRLSEFSYVYNKTNQDKADYSRASLEEYLDLYVKFKLKVQKARDMRLDTIAALNDELEGYRRQLANSYLVDKEVTEKLVREAYDRSLQDVEISHIFVTCDRNASAADTLRAYNKALRLLKMAQSGAPFEQLAFDSSEDRSAKENRGRLGFVTAMLPDGYHNLERVIYASKPGVIAGPVRSAGGYHIVRTDAFRPARGEVEVAQILIRKGDTPQQQAASRLRADSVYTALEKGMSWNDACIVYSDDKMTAPNAGLIGYFGINRYQKSFEDAAFSLAADGDYSKPVETTIGWHIIKRVSRRPMGSFETARRMLTDRVRRDSRSEAAKQSMIERIKREGGFADYPENLRKWTSMQQDSLYHTFRWKPGEDAAQTPLFKFGSQRVYTVADFEQYNLRASRERMRGRGYPVEETVGKIYKTWVEETAMEFEETQLDKKYPEFKALMREFQEGILLFEANKQLVWDKANTDTVGLEKYFNESLKNKYLWPERARASLYTVKSDDPKVIENAVKMATKKPAADVLKKMNKKGDVVAVMERLYEKEKNKDIAAIWQAGGVTQPKTDAGTKTATFFKIEEIQAPKPKTLKEAKGYAIADYQDYLEKEWIESLKKEYKVQIDKAVFESLIVK